MKGDLAKTCVFLKELDGFLPQIFRQRFVPSVSGQSFASSFLKRLSDKNGALLFGRCDEAYWVIQASYLAQQFSSRQWVWSFPSHLFIKEILADSFSFSSLRN